MTKKRIIIIMIFAAAASLSFLYLYFPRKVNIDFVKSYNIRHGISQTREIVLSRKGDLLHVCSDSTNWLYYSDIRDNMEQFEFNKFDYLFVFGKEAEEVTYSPYIRYFVDMEPHYDGQPVSVHYKGIHQQRVFVYKLPKIPKYRHLCC